MVICIFQKALRNVDIFSIITVQVIKNSTKLLGLANTQQHIKNYLGILWTNNVIVFILYVF